jgi:hypothetical protein
VWHVSLDAVQSWQATPPTPHAVAVVPLLQLPPVSQHPAHEGHGADASTVGGIDELDVELELDGVLLLLLLLVPAVELELDAVPVVPLVPLLALLDVVDVLVPRVPADVLPSELFAVDDARVVDAVLLPKLSVDV